VERLNSAAVRALADRLVSLPSVSPDPNGETACAKAVREALPPGLATGTWPTADGRPVVWALLGGRSSRTVVMLGHYDTVGVVEYAVLGAPGAERVAFDCEALRRHLLGLEPGRLPGQSSRLADDLNDERHAPGTWMFGRGSLDMKSGLAAGLAALGALATDGEELPGSVLFIACPDEEHQSAGMRAAVENLPALSEREGLELLGVLNLDYGEEPVAYAGVVGKLLAGVWVLGEPTHVSEPFRGADAAQLVAEVVRRITSSRELVDRTDRLGVPAVALRLRDLKTGYDVQTAIEAVAEFNLLTVARPLAETLEALRAATAMALADVARSMGELKTWLGASGAASPVGPVLTYTELLARAGRSAADDPLESGGGMVPSAVARDAREATLERVRRLARETGLVGPAAVVYLLPPYYPPAGPGTGVLIEGARRVLARHEMELRPFYPYISDASYVAWRSEPPELVARHLPALGREYQLPVRAMRALDLDVANLGPWGRDAHGRFERVHAPYAFGVLPGLLVEVLGEALRS
jgi:arginine utilization protein RocB